MSYFIELIYFYNQIIIGGLVSLLFLIATTLNVGIRCKSSLHCPACCWCKTRVSYFIELIYFYNQIIIGGLVSLLFLIATTLSVELIVVNHHYTVQRVVGVKQGRVILLN